MYIAYIPQFVVQMQMLISGVFLSFSETHWICLAKDAHHTPLVNKNEKVAINKQIRQNLIYTGGKLHYCHNYKKKNSMP